MIYVSRISVHAWSLYFDAKCQVRVPEITMSLEEVIKLRGRSLPFCSAVACEKRSKVRCKSGWGAELFSPDTCSAWTWFSSAIQIFLVQSRQIENFSKEWRYLCSLTKFSNDDLKKIQDKEMPNGGKMITGQCMTFFVWMRSLRQVAPVIQPLI